MDAVLDRNFAKLERLTAVVRSELAGWSASQLSLRPAVGVWSALDVVSHLALVEESFLGSVRENLAKGVAVGWRDRVGALMVNTVMRSSLRVKAPASASRVLPQSDVGFARWNRVRLDLGGLLKTLEPEQMRFGVFLHPVAGWMDIRTGMEFLAAHVQHHQYQLRRLKAYAFGR